MILAAPSRRPSRTAACQRKQKMPSFVLWWGRSMAMHTTELVSLSGILCISKVPVILKAKAANMFFRHQMILPEEPDMRPDFIAIKPLKNILHSGIRISILIWVCFSFYTTAKIKSSGFPRSIHPKSLSRSGSCYPVPQDWTWGLTEWASAYRWRF